MRAVERWELRVFRHFAWLELGSGKMARFHLAHKREPQQSMPGQIARRNDMKSDTSTPISGNVNDASKDTRGWFLGHFMPGEENPLRTGSWS